MSRREVGRVVALWRYPVKSMAAQELSTVDVSRFGLAGDRRWAFIRPGQERNDFPWLTLRQRPDLYRYRPAFTDPDRPDSSVTLVRTPSGHVYDVADPVLAAELGPDVRVIKQSRGVFDIMPVSLLTTGSVAALHTPLLMDSYHPQTRVRVMSAYSVVGTAGRSNVTPRWQASPKRRG